MILAGISVPRLKDVYHRSLNHIPPPLSSVAEILTRGAEKQERRALLSIFTFYPGGYSAGGLQSLQGVKPLSSAVSSERYADFFVA